MRCQCLLEHHIRVATSQTRKDDDGWYGRELVDMDHGDDRGEKLISGADEIKSRRRQNGSIDRTEYGTNHEQRHHPRDRLKGTEIGRELLMGKVTETWKSMELRTSNARVLSI